MFIQTINYFVDDWRADGYRWRQGGGKEFVYKGIHMKKIYFKALDERKSLTGYFQKLVYVRYDRPDVVLIQYIGDEKKAADFPHGNAKKPTSIYVRTQPHVIREIKGASGRPTTVYHELLLDGSIGDGEEDLPSTANPRNVQQVRNALKYARKAQRASLDGAVVDAEPVRNDLCFQI